MLRVFQFRNLACWVPVTLLLWAIWSIGGELFQWTPLTHDHPTHLFKAWHFYEKMLPEGKLRGWSHYWAFGHPFGELVPFGEELWVALFRALTFESFTWLKTYSLSLFALIALITFSAYIFASHYLGRFVGLVSALLTLWDPGGWAQMGWFWFMKFGVWANSLGISFLLLSMVALDRLAHRWSMSRFVGAAVLVAVSLIAHQVVVPFLPVFVALLLLDRWVRGLLRGRDAFHVLAAVGLGVSLSAFYLFPFLARSEQTLDLGVRGDEIEAVARRLVEGNLFYGLWTVLLTLGFVGAFVALRRQLPGAVFLAVGMGVFTLTSTDVMFSVFHLERVLPSFAKIEASRMLVGAKVLWFPLVAYGMSLPVMELARVIRSLNRPRDLISGEKGRWFLVWGLGLALLAPYVPGALNHLKKAQVQKVLPPEKVAYWEDLQVLWQVTARLRKESKELYRIAYELPWHDHIATIAPVFDDTWMYKIGYTPTQAFRAMPMQFGEVLFQKMMVKYVVSERNLDASHYRLQGVFGRLKLYEFLDYQGDPGVLLGPGEARVREFTPERIVIETRGTTEQSRLQLFVAGTDRWRARAGDRELPITAAPVEGAQDPFLMEVPARSGEVVFGYELRREDWVGRMASLTGMLGLASYLGFRAFAPRRYQRFKAVLSAGLSSVHSKGRARLLLFGGLFVMSAALVSGGVVVARRIQTRELMLSRTSLFKELPAGALSLDGKVCQETAPLVFQCNSERVEAVRSSGHFTHLCLSAPSGRELSYEAKRRLGKAITGRYESRNGSGHIQLEVGDRVVGSLASRPPLLGYQLLRFDTSLEADTVQLVRLKVQGAALHCFDFAIEPLTP